jgi:hypothetical protein
MSKSEDLQSAERLLSELEVLHRRMTAMQATMEAYRDLVSQRVGVLRREVAPEQVVTELLSPPVPLPERRGTRRRSGNLVPIIIASPRGGNEVLNAWVADRSADGIGLRADECQPVGTILRLRPTRAETWAQVVVRHCREEKGNWILGCQFVQKPSWSLLRIFG